MSLIRMQQRRDTAAAWLAANPVLASGEIGISTDALSLRVGDGVTAWNSLPEAFNAVPDEGRTTELLRLYTLNNRVFNVLDYGALGDGTTDDHDAIQAAITAATTGSVVWIPRTASYYRIDTSGGLADAITVNKRLTLIIDGDLRATTHTLGANPTCIINVTGADVTIMGGGTFKGDGTVDDTNTGTDDTMPTLVRVAADRFSIKDVLFDTVPKIGLHLYGAYHASVTNCRFTGGVTSYSGTAYFGIRAHQGGRHIIDGNRFYPDAGGGMLVSCIFSNNCNETIINANVAYLPYEKLCYFSGSYSIISNNVLIGNSGTVPGTSQAGTVGQGFRIDGVYNKVDGNFSRYGGGVQSLGGQGSVITDNTFLECGQAGVTVTAGAVPLTNLLIADNVMTCGNLTGVTVQSGIYVEPANAVGQSKNIKISGNTVVGFSPSGSHAQIRVVGSASDEITRAVISDNNLAEGIRGIALEFVINSFIHSNRIYATEWGILESDGGTNRFEANPVEGASNDGISGLATTSISDTVVTWTPQLSDGTNVATMGASGANAATMRRLGREVTLTGQIATTALAGSPGTVSGAVRIKASVAGLLPTCATGIKFRAQLRVGLASGLNITAGHSVTGYIDGGNDYIELQLWDATTGTTALQASEWSDDGAMLFSITYTAA